MMGLLQADQRFGAGNDARGEVHLRLIVQDKLVLLERTAQHPFDGVPGNRTDIHLLSEDLVSVAPALFGVIHRAIGVLDRRFDVLAVVGVEADADAQGDVELMDTGEMRLSYSLDQFFGSEVSVLHRLNFG